MGRTEVGAPFEVLQTAGLAVEPTLSRLYQTPPCVENHDCATSRSIPEARGPTASSSLSDASPIIHDHPSTSSSVTQNRRMPKPTLTVHKHEQFAGDLVHLCRLEADWPAQCQNPHSYPRSYAHVVFMHHRRHQPPAGSIERSIAVHQRVGRVR